MPTTYLKRLYFDALVYTHHQLEYLVEQYGADHILMGTDYPADMGEVDPVGFIESAPGLDDAERRAILGGNAARLLGLEAPKARPHLARKVAEAIPGRAIVVRDNGPHLTIVVDLPVGRGVLRLRRWARVGRTFPPACGAHPGRIWG